MIAYRVRKTWEKARDCSKSQHRVVSDYTCEKGVNGTTIHRNCRINSFDIIPHSTSNAVKSVRISSTSYKLRRGSRGGEMGEFSPPFFWAPFFFSFFLPLNQALALLHFYKNSPPISKSWIRAWSSLLKYDGRPVDQARLNALLFCFWKNEEKESKCVIEELNDLECIRFINWSKYWTAHIRTTTCSSIFRFSFLCFVGCYLFCTFLHHLLPCTCVRIFLCVTKPEHEIRNSTWNRIQYPRQPSSSTMDLFTDVTLFRIFLFKQKIR